MTLRARDASAVAAARTARPTSGPRATPPSIAGSRCRTLRCGTLGAPRSCSMSGGRRVVPRCDRSVISVPVSGADGARRGNTDRPSFRGLAGDDPLSLRGEVVRRDHTKRVWVRRRPGLGRRRWSECRGAPRTLGCRPGRPSRRLRSGGDGERAGRTPRRCSRRRGRKPGAKWWTMNWSHCAGRESTRAVTSHTSAQVMHRAAHTRSSAMSSSARSALAHVVHV